AAILRGAAVDRDVLANRVAVSDREARRLARVFLVLRIVADRRELEDAVVLADRRRAFHDRVRFDARTAADRHVLADAGVRADVRVRVHLGLRRYDSALVDQLRFPATIVIWASAATLPSTSARQSKRHKLLRLAVSSTRRIS